jgi:hypothetical protein
LRDVFSISKTTYSKVNSFKGIFLGEFYALNETGVSTLGYIGFVSVLTVTADFFAGIARVTGFLAAAL